MQSSRAPPDGTPRHPAAADSRRRLTEQTVPVGGRTVTGLNVTNYMKMCEMWKYVLPYSIICDDTYMYYNIFNVKRQNFEVNR